MPIKGLTDRGASFALIGKIRKGKVETRKKQNGQEYTVPVDLKYFRIEMATDALQAQVNELYGPEPTELNVLLPFNEIERNWITYLEAYKTGRMVARSDGEHVLFYKNANGQVTVSGGKGLDGEPVYHPEDDIAYTTAKGEPVKYKPVGRLNVVLMGLGRLAYCQVLTGSYYDVARISSQLEGIALINGGVLAGVPMILARRPAQISVTKDDGSSMYVEKWLLSLEAHPAWVAERLRATAIASLPAGSEQKQVVALLSGNVEVTERDYHRAEASEDDEIIDGESRDVEGPPPPDPFDNEPSTNGEEVVDDGSDMLAARPWPPDVLRANLHYRMRQINENVALQSEGKLPAGGELPKEDPHDRNMIAAHMAKCWADKSADKKRKEVLTWLVGKSSTKDLTVTEVYILRRWLNWRPVSDGSGDWAINAHSAKEILAAHKQALIDAEQMELPV